MSTRRLEPLPSPAPSMPDFAFGTGGASVLSAFAPPPKGVLPDSSHQNPLQTPECPTCVKRYAIKYVTDRKEFGSC